MLAFGPDGMSRRAFLTSLAAAATLAAADPFASVVVDGQRYRNGRIGLSVLMPEGWEYESVADFVALRDREVIRTGLISEVAPYGRAEDIPILLCVDPRHRSGHFAPACGAWDEPHQPHWSAAAAPALGHFLDVFSSVYRDLVVDRAPSRRPVPGAPNAAVAEWSYVHEIDDGTRQPLWVRSMVTIKDGRIGLFHFVDDRDDPRVDRSTWDEFSGSVAYDP